jgi:hypothetical protein
VFSEIHDSVAESRRGPSRRCFASFKLIISCTILGYLLIFWMARSSALSVPCWVAPHSGGTLALEERAGPEALAALARSFEGTGLDIRFTVEGSERKLPGEAELTLYRALQEGLTNALRHSNARRVTASLAFREESVSLTVADDGEGSPEGASEKGFGLATLGERAEALGGVLSAGNAPEGGFVVRVELPLETQ